jgi:hypothetical protein
MDQFCNDVDLLAIEPGIFLGGGRPGQLLAAGAGGSISGTGFVATGRDFVAAGVSAGMVLCVYTTSPSEGVAYEITSVASGSLGISVLRADACQPIIAPPAAEGLSWQVCTFAAQITTIGRTLAEKLRLFQEVGGIKVATFADSSQLRATAANGTLASIFVARAENAAPSDANWIKAQYYRRQFLDLQLAMRLVVDVDGDGVARQTRTLGNVTLRRL